MSIESEIKFTVPDRALFPQIAALTEIAGYNACDEGVRAHRDTCFDTAGRLLFRSKAVFRLRETAAGSLLTFKTQADDGAGFYRRIEVQTSTELTVADIARGNLPDIPPIAELRNRFGDIALLPALTVENSRRTILLSFRCGQPGFELVLDDVTFTGPRGMARILELEVEALEDDSALPAIGAWLRERFPLAPAGPSKYILGMELVGGIPSE